MKKFLLGTAMSVALVASPASAEEKTYNVDRIDSIEASGAFNIVVELGKKQSVTVIEEKGRFDYVDLEVNGGTLELDFEKGWHGNDGPDFTVKLVLTSLEEIDVSGANRVLLKKAKLDDLEIDASGATQLVLSGTCNNLEADISGASKLVADELKCKSIELELSGASQASIRAEKIEADTSGVSKLAVHGEVEDFSHESSGLSNMVRVKG